MTLTGALQSCRNGDAVKRESWRGYIQKVFPGAEKEETRLPNDAPFDVVVVAADGTKATYSFGTETAEEPTQLSHELLDAFLRDDWIRGSADAFEKARAGGGSF